MKSPEALYLHLLQICNLNFTNSVLCFNKGCTQIENRLS